MPCFPPAVPRLLSIPVDERSMEVRAGLLNASPGSRGIIMQMAWLPSAPASLLVWPTLCEPVCRGSADMHARTHAHTHKQTHAHTHTHTLTNISVILNDIVPDAPHPSLQKGDFIRRWLNQANQITPKQIQSLLWLWCLCFLVCVMSGYAVDKNVCLRVHHLDVKVVSHDLFQ